MTAQTHQPAAAPLYGMTVLTSSAVRVVEIMSALSHSIDMTERQPPGHVSAVVVKECRWGTISVLHPIGDLYYTLLLKDLRFSSNAARICELYTLHRSRQDAGGVNHGSVEGLDGRVLDGAVYSLDLAVGPGMLRLCGAMLDCFGAGVFEGMRAKDCARHRFLDEGTAEPPAPGVVNWTPLSVRTV